MNEKSRTRTALLVLVGALAALAIPAGLALGADESGVVGPGGVVELQLRKSGQSPDRIIHPELPNQILPTATNDCAALESYFNPTIPSNAILVIDAMNGAPGEANDHLGVKGPGDGSGEPCSRVQAGAGTAGANEILSIKPGPALVGKGYSEFFGFDLDIRLKFNSSIRATFHDSSGAVIADLTPQVFSMSGESDNGPDSEDNFRWVYVVPGSVGFSEVRLEATAGSFSLGGGQDADGNGGFVATRNSQFLVGELFDGEITCQDEVSIVDEDLAPGVVGTVTMHSMNFDPAGSDPLGWYTTGCILKFYNEGFLSPDVLFFIPELANTSGRYTLELEAPGQDIVVDEDSGQILSLGYLYDPGAGDPTTPLLECEAYPVLTGGPGNADYDAFWKAANTGMLPGEPGEHTACWFSITVSTDGAGTETLMMYFEDDPIVKFR